MSRLAPARWARAGWRRWQPGRPLLAAAATTLATLAGGVPLWTSAGCGRQPICVPICMDRVCGDDGCGGSCGACGTDQVCAGGQCLCVPGCTGRWCGDDGCGGSCGSCPASTACEQGACVCVPSCVDPSRERTRECGDDGCGGSCGACSAAEVCVGGACCAPDCFGRHCGDDGCGGTCGSCPPGTSCLGGGCACEPQCADRACGEDGCGGSCGACDAGELCVDGACCAPDCAGRWCGDDGCGGSCGGCREGEEECATSPGPVVAACSIPGVPCDALASPGSAGDQCVTDDDCAPDQGCLSVCGVRQCTCDRQSDCAEPASVCHPIVWHANPAADPAVESPGLWTCAAPCDSQAANPDAPCPAGAACQPMYVWIDGAAPGTTDAQVHDVCATPLALDCLACASPQDCVFPAYECMRAHSDDPTGSCLRPCEAGCPEGTQCGTSESTTIEACYPPQGMCGPG